MKVLRVEGWAVIGQLHVVECAGQVAPVEQVTDEDFYAGVSESLRPMVVPSNHPADRMTAADEVDCGNRPGASSGGGDENPRLHRLTLVLGTMVVTRRVSTS